MIAVFKVRTLNISTFIIKSDIMNATRKEKLIITTVVTITDICSVWKILSYEIKMR